MEGTNMNLSLSHAILCKKDLQLEAHGVILLAALNVFTSHSFFHSVTFCVTLFQEKIMLKIQKKRPPRGGLFKIQQTMVNYFVTTQQ